MNTLFKITALILAAFTNLTLAFAQQQTEAPLVPTVLECDGELRMENDGTDAYMVATGNVKLTGTNLELLCDKLNIHVKKDGESEAVIGDLGSIEYMEATGNVKLTQSQRVATAGRLIVDPAKEHIRLLENPVIKQLETSLTGKEIIIDRGNGKVTVIPGDKGNKIRFVGPAIKDLGFETDKPVEETPAPKANQNNTAKPESSTKPTEPQPAPKEETE